MGTLLLVRLATERGLRPEDVLSGSGVDLPALESCEHESTAAAELQVIRNLAAAAGPGATWGLDAGLRYHLTTFGIWGFALVSASTLHEAVDVALRFIDLTSALTAPYADLDDNGCLRMVFHEPPEPEDVARFIVQRDLSAAQVLLQEVLGPGARYQHVSFQHQPDADSLRRYAEVFGSLPEFGAAANTLVLDPALLAATLPQADAHTSAVAQAQCRELLDRRRLRAGLSGQVRDLILARLRRPPSVPEVAAALNLSERTLRRRLAAEDTSVRVLTDEVRAGLAAELLVSGSLTVAEIADRLGYVEVSSFSQAFRRWHGVSARTYLAQHADP
jgi:AraC-like DNA-binding protein